MLNILFKSQIIIYINTEPNLSSLMNKTKNKPKQQSFLSYLFELISCQLLLFYKRMNKVLLHLITRRSELERICSHETNESNRIKKIEKSLSRSKNEHLNQAVKRVEEKLLLGDSIEDVVIKIMKEKSIKRENNVKYELFIC
jgi:hypothetical protein